MTKTARNLCFHYVSERPGAMRLGVDVSTLRAVLERELAARRPARLSDYLDAPPGPDRFTVSFDDAHASVLALAAPLLASLGVPATLFVPIGWIGAGPRWLDEDGLRALRDLGWELGAHTATHPRMGVRLFGEDEAAHAARLADEQERSRERLAAILGAAPRLFAYPYGEDPPIARGSVERAGFAAAFSVRDALPLDEDLRWDGERLSIPRMDALEACGLSTLCQPEPLGISVVVPVRDRPAMLREVVRRWTAQSYPEDRFEVIVVDDGSVVPLDAEALVEDPALRARVRVIRASEPDRPFRAGQARNAGVLGLPSSAGATGASGAGHGARFPIVQLADSDVAVDADFLWAVDWVHRRNPDCVLLGALSGYNLHELGRIHRLSEVASVEDLRAVPQIPDRQREPAVRAVMDNADWLEEPWRLFYTGNVSFPRALFERVGGFEDAFQGWGLEDLDLGLRMHRAGATFVYSRFAVGLHLEDEDEPRPRNPFRREKASLEDFEGYLANLETWRGLHPGDPAVEGYAARTRSDIDEIVSRPHTIGVELGGRRPIDGPASPLHLAIHRVQPGEVTLPELLERIEHARNVGARRLWLQGGDAARDPFLLALLARAKEVGLRTGMQASPFSFAHEGAFVFEGWARRLRALGVDHVTLLFDPAHEALEPRQRAHEVAVARLRAEEIDVGARVVARSIEHARAGLDAALALAIPKVRLALPEALHDAWRALALVGGERLERLAP
jgi:peptidoglycan/xylan/chitin deacetylase (PgdA/CDA1 family)